MELPNVQENNETILNDIQSLQQTEQQLFSNLETNQNISSAEKQKIIEKMNQLSSMRVNLYKLLNGVNDYFENAMNNSIDSLKEQTVAINIVENELNQAKKRLKILEEEKNNKVRLVEINNYYSDKYEEHSQLMKIVIFILMPIIILTILNRKGVLPTSIYTILMMIIAAIGGYFFWRRFASIIMRDNMNYQEYTWYFNPNSVSTGTTTTSSDTNSDPWSSTSATGACVGDACCSGGMTFDASTNKCVDSSSVTTETFVNNVLTKTQYSKDNFNNTDSLTSANNITLLTPAQYK